MTDELRKCTGHKYFLPTMKLYLAFFFFPSYCCYIELWKELKKKIYASYIKYNGKFQKKGQSNNLHFNYKHCNVTVPNKGTSQLVRKHFIYVPNFYLILALGECWIWTLLIHTNGLLGRINRWRVQVSLCVWREKETGELFNSISLGLCSYILTFSAFLANFWIRPYSWNTSRTNHS